MDLAAMQLGDPEKVVTEIAPRIRGSQCIEEASSLLASALYERCTFGGSRSLVLSRVYLSMPFTSLDAGGQAFAREKFKLSPQPTDLFLCLLGTSGDEPDWCDLRRSQGHRAIPLNRTTITTVPMLARCFQQIGIDAEVLLQGEQGIRIEGVSRSFGIFHVEDAVGSPYVPAQEHFVVKHGVRSALGCGTMLPNGAVSIWIGFLRHQIPQGAATPLVSLMPAFWMHASSLYRRRSLFANR